MTRLQQHGARFEPPPDFVRGRVYSLTNQVNKTSRGGEALVRHYSCNLADEEAAVELVCKASLPEDSVLVAEMLERIRDAQHAVGFSWNVYGLIHADLHRWSFRFHQRRVHALDFDDCGWEHRLYDMAVTLSEVQRRQNTQALRESFLAGNRSACSLSNGHEAHLDTFIALREIKNMVWRIESRGRPSIGDHWRDVVDATLERVRQLIM